MTGTIDVIGVVASVGFVAVAVGLSLWRGVGLERSIVWASLRAAVQLVAVGAILLLVFEASLAPWFAVSWVVVMVAVAAETARRRAREVPGLRMLVAGAIGVSTGVALGIVFGFGVFDPEPVTIVAVAGITIGNALPGTVLAVDRSAAYLADNRGQIESLLALGFDAGGATRMMVRDIARLALTPQIERTKVVGLIALPGAMVGLLLAGVDPMEAVLVQLVVMYLVLGSVAVAVMWVVVAVAGRALTPDLRIEPWVRFGGGG